MWRWAVWLGLWVTWACGGQVQREPEPDSGPTASDPGAGQDDDPGEPFVEPDALEACTDGFERDDRPDLKCNWTVDGRCFVEKLDACACACPRTSSVTTCTSGFPYEDGAVPVYCS
jgi:hypothetical protein